MEDISKTKQIKFLSNEPCREDAFEGHAHQDIAKQISYIIKTNKKIHIIGLDGSWGSGKSNLISLVNKELNGDNVYDESFDHTSCHYPFFIYDAWGHQVDPQRRAILEEMTQDLTVTHKILKGKYWNDKLEALLAKRRKTSTKEVPKMGVGLIGGIIMFLLTPLIIFLENLVPNPHWITRLSITTAPYLIGFGIILYKRIKSLKDHNQKVTCSNIFSELILVYKDQIKESETYTTVSEKEPSSSEFKAWMEEINDDLKKQDKHLVIVFDNMDRLPSFQVESLWSSIHSFFSEKKYDHITVIIPFDRQHINQAFKNESNENLSYGNDFINKTFDIVFRVPPPIMSDWQIFMEDLWKKAFGLECNLDLVVTQIYGTLVKSQTPRKIIAFINEVAAFKMTIRDEIPDKYIALFILGKDKIDQNPIGELLNPSFLGALGFEYSNNPETIKYLSALYYHLPVNRALDIVFIKEAADALNEGDAKRIIPMIGKVDVSRIIADAIVKVNNIEKATYALAGLDNHLQYEGFDNMPSWLKTIWEELYSHSKHTNIQWDEVKDFHSILFQHIYSKELAVKILRGYFSIEDGKWEPEKFKNSVDNLRKGNTIIDGVLKSERKVVSPKLFINLLQVLGRKYNEYGIDYEVGEVDSYLSSLEMKDGISLEILPESKIQGKDLPKYKKKLHEWLSDINLKEIADLKNLFTRLKETGDVPIDFQNDYTDPRIYNAWSILNNSQDSFKYDILAMRISRTKNFQNSYSSHFSTILSSENEEDVKELSKVIEFYIDYGDLLNNYDDYKVFPIIRKIVEHLTIHPENTSRINCIETIKNFDKIIDNYGLEERILFNLLNRWDYSDKIKITDIPSLPIELFVEAQKNDNNLSKILLNKANEYFNTLTQEQWMESMSKDDNSCRLWRLHHPVKYQANYDALKITLKGYAEGSNVKPNESLIKEWVEINKKLGYPIKKLFNDITNILKRNSLSNKEKLLFFEDYLFDFLQMKNHGDFIIKLIPTEIIDKDIINLITNHLQELKECEISEEFKEKIKNLGSTSLKDDENIKKIRKTFKISIPKQKQSK